MDGVVFFCVCVMGMLLNASASIAHVRDKKGWNESETWKSWQTCRRQITNKSFQFIPVCICIIIVIPYFVCGFYYLSKDCTTLWHTDWLCIHKWYQWRYILILFSMIWSLFYFYYFLHRKWTSIHNNTANAKVRSVLGGFCFQLHQFSLNNIFSRSFSLSLAKQQCRWRWIRIYKQRYQ